MVGEEVGSHRVAVSIAPGLFGGGEPSRRSCALCDDEFRLVVFKSRLPGVSRARSGATFLSRRLFRLSIDNAEIWRQLIFRLRFLLKLNQSKCIRRWTK